MPGIRRALVVFFCAAAMTSARAAPQGLPSLYELVDVGPVAAPQCSCVAAPFTLPAYHPDTRFHLGAATPAARGRTFPDPVLLSSSDASTFFAYHYLQGLGIPQNDGAAAFWYYDSALKGHNVGMVAVGMMYAAGRGVGQDFEAAVWWWQRAKPTTPLASRLLGDAYACGLGITASAERALIEYQRAADRGDVSGSIQLGDMYANGCGPADDEAAVAAYRRAGDEGYPEAQIALSDLVRVGRGVETPNPSEAYYLARIAELRLPTGPLRSRASDSAKSASRLLSVDQTAAVDQMVQAMLAEAAKAIR